MSMPSMEGEEGCYLKKNLLACAAPLEAHHKQKEGTLHCFSSTMQNSALVYANGRGNTLLCAKFFSTAQ